MKPIKTFLWAFLLLLTALWWMTDTPAMAGLGDFSAWRSVLMQYSGVLAIGVMSVAMLLAVRPVLFEPYLGGLDKMYRLHKWLGISALVISVSHWLLS
ncbi:MAG TPA: ferric reductase-like transmembrane domain-containing protein, partial [Rhodoferax sp.]|nr:ferric reductase-like transmembrane domain-containing protein [Rhodoferax sp.]